MSDVATTVGVPAEQAGPERGAGLPVTSLTVLYDEFCPFCVRCRDWLASQPCLVRMELLGANSPAARRRYGTLAAELGNELLVVDDTGRKWSGPAAFLMCLWATDRYRSMAEYWSDPGRIGHAERFFEMISRNRGRFGPRLDQPECERCATGTPAATGARRKP